MKANRTRPINLTVPTASDTDLVELDAQAVGIWLELLEDSKTPGRWDDPAIALDGWQLVTKQQEELLMGAVDRLISEVRAVRQGDATPLAAQDPLLDPYGLDLFTLQDIGGFLSTNGKSAAFILEEIRALQELANTGDAEALAELGKIVAIIVGVV